MKTPKPDIITEFNSIIDAIETRAMAMDGPVTPTLEEARESELARLWELLNAFKNGKGWINSKERKPECNVSVLVFIPEEDDHITTGMWDISNKWVLLDEYRVPVSDVTYWHPMIAAPEDKSFHPSTRLPEESDTITYKTRELQKRNLKLITSLRSIVLSVKAHPDYKGVENDEWTDLVSIAEKTLQQV